MIKTIILLLFLQVGSVVTGNSAFKMLQSNLISGLIPDIEDGYGVVFRDLNGDGYPDVYLVCFRNMNRLLVNNGGIIPFVDRTVFSGLGGDLSSRGKSRLELGASCADFNNDGIVDLFVGGWGKTTKLFEGRGKFRFDEVTKNLNIRGLSDANQGLWLDADNDGFLDIYITDEHYSNRLLLNNKNGSFRNGVWAEGFIDTATSQGAVAGDFDGDGDADIYVANWHSSDYLLLNNGNGLFRRSVLDLPTLVESSSCNSAVFADLDNDGRAEILVAGQNGYVYLYQNKGEAGHISFVSDTTTPFYHIGKSVYGINAEDFNQDGWLDLFLSIREGHNRLYLNDGNGSFESDFDSETQRGYSTGSAAGDVDGDGDLDIFVANKNIISQAYLNPINQNHFIKVTLTGVRSNRDALGAKCFLYTGADSLRKLIGFREVTASTGYLSAKDPQLYFGLGSYTNLQLEVTFPSGKSISRKGLVPGKNYHFFEYGSMLRAGFTVLRFAQFHVKRWESWANLFLLIFLALQTYLFLRVGFRRYHWQAAELATQLVIWFALALVSFIAVKDQILITILSTLVSISFLGILISVLYSEHQLRIRRRRILFRNQVQHLSARMINIHDDQDLLKDIRDTLLAHEDIKDILYLNFDSGEHLLKNSAAPRTAIKLTEDEIQILKTNDNFLTLKQTGLSRIFATFGITVVLPVRQADRLIALISLEMQNFQSPINREDLQLLLPLAHQTAIAIENNKYIQESEQLVRELTESRIKQKYVQAVEKTNLELDYKNKELNRLLKELKEKEGQLIHSEKMASLGHLVAGISHELNNPISFIYANTKALSNYLAQLQEIWDTLDLGPDSEQGQQFKTLINELKSIVTDNLNGSQNVKELVLNLKNFSRLDQEDWKEAHLVEGIESGLKILKPQISDQIEIVRNFNADPQVFCNPGQLNQVFLNLMSNALQAIDGPGKITIHTQKHQKWFLVEVTDTGRGIPKEIQQKIFDPFFTTKEVNQGTGLGLSISYTIVKSHGGKLTVDSIPGKGTTFKVLIPIVATEHQNTTN